jgi:hypothetical protein
MARRDGRRYGELDTAVVVGELAGAGRDLAGVVDDLAAWGTRWLEVTTDHTDPSFALWAWCESQIDGSNLPRRRSIVGCTFPDERPSKRRYWIPRAHPPAPDVEHPPP